MHPTRHQRRQRLTLLAMIPVLVCVLVALVVLAAKLPDLVMSMDRPTESTTATTPSTDSTAPDSTTAPTESTGTTGTTEPTGTTGTTEPTGTTGSTEPQPTETQPSTQPAEPVDLEAFFSETVFIGDSITYGLSTYCNIYNPLYGARFLCASSYAVRHAIVDPEPGNENIVSIKFQGESMRPEDALAKMGAKRVFIMLGLNDISFGVDYTIGNWEILIKNIQEKCPDIEIYIQSATPLHAKRDNPNNKLCNKNMNAYNEKLQALCQEMGCYYVDVASALKDENGQLKNEYCSDEYCHMSYAGIDVWINTLKEYAAGLNS